jgi:hypothetical protein
MPDGRKIPGRKLSLPIRTGLVHAPAVLADRLIRDRDPLISRDVQIRCGKPTHLSGFRLTLPNHPHFFPDIGLCACWLHKTVIFFQQYTTVAIHGIRFFTRSGHFRRKKFARRPRLIFHCDLLFGYLERDSMELFCETNNTRGPYFLVDAHTSTFPVYIHIIQKCATLRSLPTCRLRLAYLHLFLAYVLGSLEMLLTAKHNSGPT